MSGGTPEEALAWLQQQGIANSLAVAIQSVLIDLWTAAWAAGREAAGDNSPDDEGLQSLLNQLASKWIYQIVQTTLKLLAKALSAGEALEGVLQDLQRAKDIVQTEVTRVMSWAAQKVYTGRGTIYVRWVTEDDNACQECLANQAAGRWPLGVPFPSGAVLPPQHVRCRCAVIPA